jgi:hypothetical protein
MKKFRFYVAFKDGARSDWIHCDSERDTPQDFLSVRGDYGGVIDEKGNAHFINWDNVNYAKAEEVV